MIPARERAVDPVIRRTRPQGASKGLESFAALWHLTDMRLPTGKPRFALGVAAGGVLGLGYSFVSQAFGST